MKRLVFIVLSLLTVFNCEGQKQKIKSGPPPISNSPLRKTEFRDIFHSDIVSNYDSVYIYDYKFSRKGKIRDSTLIAVTSLVRPNKGNYYCTYDSLGRVHQSYNIIDKNTTLKSENIYGQNGKMEQSLLFASDGNVHTKTFYEYNQKGKLLTEKTFLGPWSRDTSHLERLVNYQYLNNKLVEKNEFYDQKPDSTWTEYRISRYDTSGKIISYKEDDREFNSLRSCFYNDSGLLTTEIFEANEYKSVKSYTYSEIGLPVQLLWTYPDKKKDSIIRLTRYYYR